jgi:hypothetical protein
MTGSTNYARMCSAIEECERIDEAAAIQDPAARLAAYVRQARNTDAERQASAIRLRAEWCYSILLRDAAGLPPKNKKARAWLARFEGKAR